MPHAIPQTHSSFYPHRMVISLLTHYKHMTAVHSDFSDKYSRGQGKQICKITMCKITQSFRLEY